MRLFAMRVSHAVHALCQPQTELSDDKLAQMQQQEGTTVVGDKFRLQMIIAWICLGLILKIALGLAYLGGSDLRSGAILQVTHSGVVGWGLGGVVGVDVGVRVWVCEQAAPCANCY